MASKIDREITEWVNNLTGEQMCKLYEIIDGPLPEELKEMSDDEILAELES